MKRQRISEAMNEISPKLLQKAIDYSPADDRKTAFFKIAPIAACLIACVLIGFSILQNNRLPDNGGLTKEPPVDDGGHTEEPPVDDGGHTEDPPIDSDPPEAAVPYDATYFAFPHSRLGYESFFRVIKDGDTLDSYLTEHSLDPGDYSVFFAPYDHAFFEERTLIALYMNEMMGAYPMVKSFTEKEKALHLTVATVSRNGYEVNGKRGVMILLALEKDTATEDLTIEFTFRSTDNETEYDAAYEPYQKGPMPVGEALDFTVAGTVFLRPEDVKGYTCSVDRATVLDSYEAFKAFQSQNVRLGDYDEAFFETKSLVLVFARPVSSTQLPFVDVTDLRRMTNKDGNSSFAVTVKYNVQQIGTDDINRICYVVETDADPELAQSSVSTSHVYINVWKP
ncbi:MAG: hypothetical protein E7599_00155 [Ruminococcaceae bacterium]|nr:hypothetical protein [Oscillospiraceae bacterium]